MSQPMTQPSARRKPFRRLLLTGAAGNLGRQLRGALAEWADVVRVSDIARARRAGAARGNERRRSGGPARR